MSSRKKPPLPRLLTIEETAEVYINDGFMKKIADETFVDINTKNDKDCFRVLLKYIIIFEGLNKKKIIDKVDDLRAGARRFNWNPDNPECLLDIYNLGNTKNTT